MRINRNEMIAGQPIKVARDLAKAIGDHQIEVAFITRRLALNLEDSRERRANRHNPNRQLVRQARALAGEMMARGWLKEVNDRRFLGHWYECTNEGTRLGLASMLKPIPRAKAEKIVAGLIERAHAVNSTPELIYSVKRLRVFGSYITQAEDLGDIDIAFELERRRLDNEGWVEANERRARLSGKQVRWPNTIIYGEIEVQLRLKNRDRYLSLHPADEPERLKAESRVIFGQ